MALGQQQSGTLNSLELLTVIDIIKNEELYRQKIEELKAADARLADSRFIAATVEAANKMKAEADRKLALAKQALEDAEEEQARIVAAGEAKVSKLHDEVKEKLNEAQQIETKAQEWVNSFHDREQAVEIQHKRNQAFAEQLANKENALLAKESHLKQCKQELEAILRKI